jgi:hypothetical protein
MKLTSYGLGIGLIAAAIWVGAGPAKASPVKLTGWFSCEKCTAARVAKGDITPSNTECAKQCIAKDSEAVFLSEEGKESFRVRNYAAVKDDLGYHVAVTGTIDRASKSISIQSVEKLELMPASCSRSANKGK